MDNDGPFWPFSPTTQSLTMCSSLPILLARAPFQCPLDCGQPPAEFVRQPAQVYVEGVVDCLIDPYFLQL